MARILAISSHVVRGQVGLAATVPALQSLGHEVWALPTVLLASRPGLGRMSRYELPPAEQKKIKQLPGSLDLVLDNLEKDHEFLLKGDVFTPDLIETWIEYKRKNEVDPIRLRPHPWEFALYFNI